MKSTKQPFEHTPVLHSPKSKINNLYFWATSLLAKILKVQKCPNISKKHPKLCFLGHEAKQATDILDPRYSTILNMDVVLRLTNRQTRGWLIILSAVWLVRLYTQIYTIEQNCMGAADTAQSLSEGKPAAEPGKTAKTSANYGDQLSQGQQSELQLTSLSSPPLRGGGVKMYLLTFYLRCGLSFGNPKNSALPYVHPPLRGGIDPSSLKISSQNVISNFCHCMSICPSPVLRKHSHKKLPKVSNDGLAASCSTEASILLIQPAQDCMHQSTYFQLL